MKEHLINLRDWEAAALNEGRATVLVRVAKVNGESPPEWATFAAEGLTLRTGCDWVPSGLFYWSEEQTQGMPLKPLRRWPVHPAGHPMAGYNYWTKSPFGAPGDAILGREAMYLHKHAGSRGGWLYRADNSQVSVSATDDDAVREMREWAHKTARSHCSSTQMPSWAIRARYTVAGVRCMRVQEMSAGDMWECGMPASQDVDPAHEYDERFDRDHGPGAWAENPWIFFARLTK